jgi:hypothetical protein
MIDRLVHQRRRPLVNFAVSIVGCPNMVLNSLASICRGTCLSPIGFFASAAFVRSAGPGHCHVRPTNRCPLVASAQGMR